MSKWLSVLAILGTVGLAQADWPLFRGNAEQSGIALGPLPNPLVIRWKIKRKDSVEGAAAMVANSGYVGSLHAHLFALDLVARTEKRKYSPCPLTSPRISKGGP